jgi:hypothetical protein
MNLMALEICGYFWACGLKSGRKWREIKIIVVILRSENNYCGRKT